MDYSGWKYGGKPIYLNDLTVGSLFAGVGGFDLAAEAAGMQVAWQSEYDKHANSVLADHWPEVTNYGDITQINADELPRVDVLTGGFPCQDYSISGSRGGLAGDRGALWWHYERIIAAQRPQWVVGENVVGLLSSNEGADFHTILDSLRNLGYSVGWRVLDAQWFGVPQRRRRVFIVANLGGKSPSKVLALSQGMSGDTSPHRQLKQNATGGPQTRTYTRQRTDEYQELDVASTLTQRDYKSATDLIVAGGVRRLTPLECERLQGFPDGWTATQSDTQRYRQMGNAVAVPVVTWLLKQLNHYYAGDKTTT